MMNRERQRMRRQFLGSLIFLNIQFLLGMAVNLFVKVPLDHPGARPSDTSPV